MKNVIKITMTSLIAGLICNTSAAITCKTVVGRNSSDAKLSELETPINVKKSDHEILMDAVHEGDLKLVKSMLDSGFGANKWDKRGTPLLTVAISNKHFEIAKLLLQSGADPYDTFSGGYGGPGDPVYTVIGYASSSDHKGGVKYPDQVEFLESKISRVKPKSLTGYKADSDPKVEKLIEAVKNDDITTVEHLLKIEKVDPNGIVNGGSTALGMAAWKRDLRMFKLLVDHGALVFSPILKNHDDGMYNSNYEPYNSAIGRLRSYDEKVYNPETKQYELSKRDQDKYRIYDFIRERLQE